MSPVTPQSDNGYFLDFKELYVLHSCHNHSSVSFFQGTWQLLQASYFCACSKLQLLSGDPFKDPGGYQDEVTVQHRL